MCLLMLGSGALLLIGFMTRLQAGLAFLGGIGIAFFWFPTPNWNFFSDNPLTVDAIIMVRAAAFLGPGALPLNAACLDVAELSSRAYHRHQDHDSSPALYLPPIP